MTQKRTTSPQFFKSVIFLLFTLSVINAKLYPLMFLEYCLSELHVKYRKSNAAIKVVTPNRTLFCKKFLHEVIL